MGILRKNFAWARNVTYSSDGRFIAASSAGPNIRIWDAKTYRCIGTLKGKKKETALKRNQVLSRMLQHFCRASMGHSGAVNCVTFSPDSSMILTCSHDGTAKIWDVNAKKCLCTLKFVPGLKVRGINLCNLHPKSELSGEDREILKMYGAMLD